MENEENSRARARARRKARYRRLKHEGNKRRRVEHQSDPESSEHESATETSASEVSTGFSDEENECQPIGAGTFADSNQEADEEAGDGGHDEQSNESDAEGPGNVNDIVSIEEEENVERDSAGGGSEDHSELQSNVSDGERAHQGDVSDTSGNDSHSDGHRSDVESEGSEDYLAHSDSGSESEESEAENSEDSHEEGNSESSLEESDEDDVDDDMEGNEPIYPGAQITLHESLLSIFTLLFVENLSGALITKVLQLIALHCPDGSIVKRTLHTFRAYFSKLGESLLVFHFFCSECKYPLKTKTSRCLKCKKNSDVSYFLELPLLQQLQNLFSRNDFYQNLQYRFKADRKYHSDNIEDIYDGEIYKGQMENGFLQNMSNISFMWYSDGVSIFKSSSFSIWPLCLVINELPYKMRTLPENILLVGLWFGKGKPSPNVFFKPLQKNMKTFTQDGHTFKLPDNSLVLVKGKIICGTCDLPAKCNFLLFKQFNSYFGCPKCMIAGGRAAVNNSTVQVYPYSANIQQRTHEETVQYAREALEERKNNKDASVYGVKGPSLLLKLVPDIIKCTAIDIMHGVFWGVCKMLMKLWFSSTYSTMPWSIHHLTGILDEKLKKIKSPSFVQRAPRQLKDMKFWKASEYKLFLLYYSVPLLKNVLSEVYLKHHCLLVSAIYLLSQDSISPSPKIPWTPWNSMISFPWIERRSAAKEPYFHGKYLTWKWAKTTWRVILHGEMSPMTFLDVPWLMGTLMGFLDWALAQVQTASKLLMSYVSDFARLYALRFLGMNVHQLIHLSDQVLDLGPLWVYTCAFLENYNGKINKFFHGTQHIAMQICSTASMFMQIPVFKRMLPPDSKVKGFCDKLKNWRKPFKIADVIDDYSYAVGTYSFNMRDIRDTGNVVQRCLNKFSGSCSIFYRLRKNGVMYFSEEYGRLSSRKKSSFIQFLDGETKQLGCILRFVRWSNCRNLCDVKCRDCPAQFFATVKVYERDFWFAHEYRNVRLSYMCKVTCSNRVVAIDVQSIISLCFFYEANGDMFIVTPINRLEIE
ncbi:Halomucin [Frankliniella fusca]|uniref:Halomucin n=1 Tax=Frankliniella fusca TaxID=407009 RepID=A0AAE1HS50_9NEOP|nr:Halomucin [Frankliniella fusca]